MTPQKLSASLTLLLTLASLPACRDRHLTTKPTTPPAPPTATAAPLPTQHSEPSTQNSTPPLITQNSSLITSPPIPKHTATFLSNTIKISYTESSPGSTATDAPPVLLVHGLYSSANLNWELPGTFDLLAKKYHVIALDLRGHGQSDKPTAEADYGTPMEEDLTRLLDHLHIQKAHLVGYSLGGIVVLKFVSDHPDRALSASLGGMGWLRDGSLPQGIFEFMGGRNPTTPPAAVHGISKLALTQPQLLAIKPPLSILVGTDDPCLRLYVQPLQKARPDIPVTLIQNAGHISCVTNPDFKSNLQKWFDSQPLPK